MLVLTVQNIQNVRMESNVKQMDYFMCLVRETEIATMKSCVCVHCTADVLPSTVASHSYIVLLSVGGVTVAQEVCSSVV